MSKILATSSKEGLIENLSLKVHPNRVSKTQKVQGYWNNPITRNSLVTLSRLAAKISSYTVFKAEKYPTST